MYLNADAIVAGVDHGCAKRVARARVPTRRRCGRGGVPSAAVPISGRPERSLLARVVVHSKSTRKRVRNKRGKPKRKTNADESCKTFSNIGRTVVVHVFRRTSTGYSRNTVAAAGARRKKEIKKNTNDCRARFNVTLPIMVCAAIVRFLCRRRRT